MVTRHLFRTSLLALLSAAFLPALHASSADENILMADARFSSSFEMFYMGPQWFRNAMPSFSVRARSAALTYDSAGDRTIYEATYVGTLRDEPVGNMFGDMRALNRSIGSFAPLAPLAPDAPNVNGITYTWSTTTTGTSWLNSANWTGGVANKYPGVDANPTSTADGAANDIATFTTLAISGNTIGINFNTSGNSGNGNNTGANGSLALGTIVFNPSKALTINNNSPTLDGTLTLNGTNTINGINNTILTNEGAQNVTLTNGSSRRMDVALGDPTNNVIQVNGSGNLTITSLIKNATANPSNLTLTSTGTPTGQLILNSPLPNTFTGTTTVDVGTMNLVTAGALGGTSGVTVNNGGTVLLSGNAIVTDRINNAAGITLNGGTFNSGGLSEGSATAVGAGMGALTLTANSTIDLGAGSSILHFAGIGAHTPGTGPDLAITNWTGSPVGGGPDQLLFTGVGTTFEALYDQSDVSFNGITGYDIIQFTGYYELVPIPEASTWIGAALALAAIAFTQRNRIRGLRGLLAKS